MKNNNLSSVNGYGYGHLQAKKYNIKIF
uniref:Uncharacterized protein n=1 Tax=Anguilla anguilla TaxID=7936 RepID=A0A0E9VFR9_ANGAN